jgi:hypothetical protein
MVIAQKLPERTHRSTARRRGHSGANPVIHRLRQDGPVVFGLVGILILGIWLTAYGFTHSRNETYASKQLRYLR